MKFCAWLFALLGMQPGDELVDLFPGTGIVGAAWSELSSPGDGRRSTTSARALGDVAASTSDVVPRGNDGNQLFGPIGSETAQ